MLANASRVTRPLNRIQPIAASARGLGQIARTRAGAVSALQPAAQQHGQELWASTRGSGGLVAKRILQRQTLCRATEGDVTDSVSEDGGSTVELEIKVEGMMCGGCSSRVTEALKALSKVRSVEVDLDSKLASVEVEAPSLMDAIDMLPGFVQAIKDLGFEAEPHIEYQS
ncbi:MAG: hypothetical protein J3K34DRAFT_430619 [Monoraphidium minutum]|nr:MAG: hypothetical protein J3K34DRAFT_430619 [Monoraphidium minutum]